MTPLYVSDLDGTLLHSDATLSPFSRDTLNDLLAQGLQFTVASARSIITMQTVLSGLQLRLPIIEFNGTFITDLHTGRHLDVCALEPTIVDDILAQACAADLEPFVSTYDDTADRLYYHEPPNEGMRWHWQNRVAAKDPRLCYLDDLRRALTEQVVCFTMIGRLQQVAALDETLRAAYDGLIETHLYENQYSLGWHWLTIHDRRAGKEKAIQTLITLAGLKPSELVVFGDQVNDLAMLRMAQRGIAMRNAVPDLQRTATQIIGANDDDSVARFIAADWSGQNGRYPTKG
ncbi:MAG: HAD family phosphatase [Anaerolineales bacterium]|nr:HAD family phosphatase [Anaerolineales bacterium]